MSGAAGLAVLWVFNVANELSAFDLFLLLLELVLIKEVAVKVFFVNHFLDFSIVLPAKYAPKEVSIKISNKDT